MINRDELAESLKIGFSAIIKETDDWRPLANHILDLIELAVNNEIKNHGFQVCQTCKHFYEHKYDNSGLKFR